MTPIERAERGGGQMESTTVPRRGPIEGTSRVLRELLRTPRFKKTVGILLRELDPENAGLLVRTLMWEDPEFFLSLLGAAPGVANSVINGLRELVGQLSNFPPGLLASFVSIILEEVDAEGLGRAFGDAGRLLTDVQVTGGEDFLESVSGLVRRFAAGVAGTPTAPGALPLSAEEFVEALLPALGALAGALGKEASREGSEMNRAVRRLAAGVRQVAADNPEFMGSVVAPLVEAGRDALAGGGTPGEAS